jgi:hypothetical protein
MLFIREDRCGTFLPRGESSIRCDLQSQRKPAVAASLRVVAASSKLFGCTGRIGDALGENPNLPATRLVTLQP